MIGIVLAAGAGKRLLPLTRTLPKTLLTVGGGRSILDVALANLRAVGLQDVLVVTGVGAREIERRVGDLERRHGVRLELLHNPHAEDWNNAYSLWCARRHFAGGALLVNGDTLHPASVEERLLTAPEAGVLLAVDDHKALGAEEMKVRLREDGRLARLSKDIDPTLAEGEYIGLTLIASSAAEALADALEATWRRDPGLYYENGFVELAERGGDVRTVPIGDVGWIEVDDHADLARARELPCLS